MIWASFNSIFWGYDFGRLRRVVWHYLVLFILVIKSQKMQKKCRKIMWPRTYRNCKAKQSQTWDIFKILFHMLCVRNLKSLQKILKSAENLCDHGHATIMMPNWAKLWNKLLSVFWWPPAMQSHNPTSLSQVLLVMISVVGSLLGSWAHCWWKLWMAVSNRSWLQWQVLMQWWVVAEVTSGCSQGQHNQLCLHSKCGLWAEAPAVFLMLECRGLLMIWFCHDQFPQCAPCCQQQLATNHLYMYVCIMSSWVETDML